MGAVFRDFYRHSCDQLAATPCAQQRSYVAPRRDGRSNQADAANVEVQDFFKGHAIPILCRSNGGQLRLPVRNRDKARPGLIHRLKIHVAWQPQLSLRAAKLPAAFTEIPPQSRLPIAIRLPMDPLEAL
jgi:hypothetical protein